MIGFDKGVQVDRILDDASVTAINADLTTSTDLTQAKTLQENLGLCFIGTKKLVHSTLMMIWHIHFSMRHSIPTVGQIPTLYSGG